MASEIVKFKVPGTRDQGPVTLIGRSSSMETAYENALWDYNRMRDHDGQRPLTRLPAGTRAIPVSSNPGKYRTHLKKTLARKRIYEYEGTDDTRKVFVLGYQFGPMMITRNASLEEAIDEFDEKFGTRVKPNDPDLKDYGDTPEEAVEEAMNSGDIRINDGGTMVWVDHSEWFREFPNYGSAMKWIGSV